jgi:peptide deformylase
MKLVNKDDVILKTVMENFSFIEPPTDPIELSIRMGNYMEDHNGLGLAANQVGLPYRMFVMRGPKGPISIFNPRIVDNSEEIIELDEGCLTFPNFYAKIRRPLSIKVRYQNEYGETFTEKFNGMTARVFQHELDHLNGITMIDKLSGTKKQKALKKLKVSERNKHNQISFSKELQDMFIQGKVEDILNKYKGVI